MKTLLLLATLLFGSMAFAQGAVKAQLDESAKCPCNGDGDSYKLTGYAPGDPSDTTGGKCNQTAKGVNKVDPCEQTLKNVLEGKAKYVVAAKQQDNDDLKHGDIVYVDGLAKDGRCIPIYIIDSYAKSENQSNKAIDKIDIANTTSEDAKSITTEGEDKKVCKVGHLDPKNGNLSEEKVLGAIGDN